MRFCTSEYRWKCIDLFCHAPAARHRLVIEQLYGPHLTEEEKHKGFSCCWGWLVGVNVSPYNISTLMCVIYVSSTSRTLRSWQSIDKPKKENYLNISPYISCTVPELAIEMRLRDISPGTDCMGSCQNLNCREWQWGMVQSQLNTAAPAPSDRAEPAGRRTMPRLHVLGLIISDWKAPSNPFKVFTQLPVLAWQRLRLPSSRWILGRQI